MIDVERRVFGAMARAYVDGQRDAFAGLVDGLRAAGQLDQAAELQLLWERVVLPELRRGAAEKGVEL